MLIKSLKFIKNKKNNLFRGLIFRETELLFSLIIYNAFKKIRKFLFFGFKSEKSTNFFFFDIYFFLYNFYLKKIKVKSFFLFLNLILKKSKAISLLNFYNLNLVFLKGILKKYFDFYSLKDVEISLFFVKEFKYLKEVLAILTLEPQLKYKLLSDIIAVDRLKVNDRFLLTYNLLSLSYNNRLYLKFKLNDLEFCQSVCYYFKGASWQEREVWDLFGIFFEGNPDLRRILTDYGFEGNPLRKDFPLTGYVELYYNEDKKKIIYEPVSLSQKYRNFQFEQKWVSSSAE